MTIRRSRTRSLLIGVLALAGVRALALCDLPVLLFVVFAAALLAFAAREVLEQGGTLLGRDENGRWHLAHPGRRPFSGRLAEAGYRGAMLVVVVLDRCDEDDRGDSNGHPGGDARGGIGGVRLPATFSLPGRARRHVAVFADSVSPRDFSRLHFELALAAGEDPADGTPRSR